MSRHAAAIVLAAGLLAVLAAACGGGASPSPRPSPTAAPTPAVPTPAAPTATAAGSDVTRTPAPTATQAAPTVAAFWAAAARGIVDAGRVGVAISGPNPGRLRFEATASATVVDGEPGFVCIGDRAYDGQSGWAEVPGSWTCGADAFVAGFRNMGQPIDAWNETVPRDDAIRETVRVTDEGRWRWDYRGTSAYFGGRVTAVVIIDPATGRIVDATRTDPTGDSTYRLTYGATFPPIAVPG